MLLTQDEASKALGTPVPAGAEKTMTLPLQGATIEAQYCFYGTEVIIARLELGPKSSVLISTANPLQLSPGIKAWMASAMRPSLPRASWPPEGTTGLIVDVGQARGGGPREEEAEKTLAARALGRM